MDTIARQIITDPNYQGISIFVNNNTISVIDGTVAPSTAPVSINFNDMMSQPTWQDLATVQVDLVARGDIVPHQRVQLPPFVSQNTASSRSGFRNNSTFTGIGSVLWVRHVGDLRQANGNAWKTTCTIFMQKS
jgi:hypothetical protein